MNKILVAAGFLLLGFSACKKVEETKTVDDSIRGTWSRTSGKSWARNPFTGVVDTVGDYTANLPTCIKDDGLEFLTNYKGSTHLGSDQCNVGDPESVPFRWETTNNGKGLRIYDVAEYFPQVRGNVNADILILTKGFMTLRYTVDTFFRLPQTPGGTDTMIVRDTVTYTDIFQKQ